MKTLKVVVERILTDDGKSFYYVACDYGKGLISAHAFSPSQVRSVLDSILQYAVQVNRGAAHG